MMQNLLSGILAVIIALTSMCGGLLNSNADRPFAAEIGVDLEGDPAALAIGGQSADSSAAIMDLISSIGIRFAATADVGQLQIELKDEPFAALTVQRQADGWAAVSDLFPGVLLTVKNDTLASFAAQSSPVTVNGSPASIDFAAIFEAAKGPFEQLLEQLRAKLGEPETGSFTVGGVEYTQKAVYGLTTKEALEMVMATVKTILSNETISGVIPTFVPDFSADSVDQAMADIMAADEADQPVLSAAEYRNGADVSAQEIILAKDGQSIEFLWAENGKIITALLSALDQLEGSMIYDKEDRNLKLDLALASPSGVMQVMCEVDIDDDDIGVDLDLTMPSGDTSITIGLDIDIDWEAPVFTAAEGLTEVTLESVLEDPEGAEAFNNQITQAMMALLLKVASSYPDIMMMMVPSSGQGAVVEEAPAE